MAVATFDPQYRAATEAVALLDRSERGKLALSGRQAAEFLGPSRYAWSRTRRAEKLVQKQPGITIAKMAKRIRIQPDYLYRLLPHLEKDGKVKKRDEGYRQRAERGGGSASLDWTHHHVSREQLHRYVAEFDFRFSTCKESDTERM